MERPSPKFLEDQERSLLVALHRKEKCGKIRDKLKVILLLDKGWSYEKISEALFLDYKTPMRRYEDYVRHGVKGLIDSNFAGKVSLLTAEQAQTLASHLGRVIN